MKKRSMNISALTYTHLVFIVVAQDSDSQQCFTPAFFFFLFYLVSGSEKNHPVSPPGAHLQGLKNEGRKCLE